MRTDNQAAARPPGPRDPVAHRRLVVVGASVRALAESAARAGLDVYAADLFGDRDLLSVARGFQRAVPYPDCLPQLVTAFPPGPWCYTGGLENHPDLISAISRLRPLAGSTAAAVRRVRDHAWIQRLAEATGLMAPETAFDPAGLPLDGSWLVKPRRSAGGHGIRSWRGSTPDPLRPDDWIWQRKAPGRPWSVALLIDETGCRLLGVSRQLIGSRWTAAKPFHWCGGLDLDPAILPDRIARPLDALGRGLAAASGLRGLVGVDLLIDARGGITLLEINPRPTASMELIERATSLPLAAAHLAAAGLGPPIAQPPDLRRQHHWAKAILFARRSLSFTDLTADRLDALAATWTAEDGWSAAADLPTQPQTIPAGRPVCTVFAAGPSPARALRELGRRMRHLRRLLDAEA